MNKQSKIQRESSTEKVSNSTHVNITEQAKSLPEELININRANPYINRARQKVTSSTNINRAGPNVKEGPNHNREGPGHM